MVGRGHALYALAQGDWPLGGEAGSPAAPSTGQLFRVGRHGSLELIADGLNQPVSFQLIRGTSYVTLGGEVGRPPRSRALTPHAKSRAAGSALVAPRDS